METATISRPTTAPKGAVKSQPKPASEQLTITEHEEIRLVKLYRQLARWEKNGAFIVLSSLAYGRLLKEGSDHLSWPQMQKVLEISKGGE